MYHWYVVQTKPQKEAVVLGLLTKANVDVFVPMIRRFKTRTCPLFPRYCFVRADLSDQTQHHMIRFTRGVTRILGDDSGPAPIAEDIVSTIRATTANGSLIEQELLYKPGDRVTVKSGVLQDLVGIVERNLSENGRIRILFKWLARKIRADIDYRQLERAA
jgi:transcription antitermination factor NusG